MADKSTRGGARPNSGPEPKPRAKLRVPGGKKPLDFLLDVMNDVEAEAGLRVRAAVAAAQYMHTKTTDGGKKEARDQAAKAVLTGKYAPAAPPNHVVKH